MKNAYRYPVSGALVLVMLLILVGIAFEKACHLHLAQIKQETDWIAIERGFIPTLDIIRREGKLKPLELECPGFLGYYKGYYWIDPIKKEVNCSQHSKF